MQSTINFFVVIISSIYLKNANSRSVVPRVISNLQQIDSLLHEVIDIMSASKIQTPGPMDCKEIQNSGYGKSGIYRIWPLNWVTSGSFLVYCDMETDGGGWTTFQRRGNYGRPKDYFYRGWEDYSLGFGKLNEDFWLGNERIYALTNQGKYSLRIDMKDKEGNKRYAVYKEFWIENEKHKYKLHISGFDGNAGDSFSDLNEMYFSTKDRDNDAWENNCAETYKGGWWYNICHSVNLNGLYLDGYHSTFADGINWRTWKGYNYSLPEVDMKIRRVNEIFYDNSIINQNKIQATKLNKK